MSGKNLVREKLPKTVYCCLCLFLTLLSLWISFWFHVRDCCIPTPTTDSNTSKGMIWVTLNMGRSVANCQGNVMELSGNFTWSGEWSPFIMLCEDFSGFSSLLCCGLFLLNVTYCYSHVPLKSLKYCFSLCSRCYSLYWLILLSLLICILCITNSISGTL